MKILPVEKIREADEYTIKNEPISDINLMERAASACFDWIYSQVPIEKKILVVCGTGNNGGDGFAIARMMATSGYKVDVLLVGDHEKLSNSCRINYDRFKAIINGQIDHFVQGKYPESYFHNRDIIIDALFGSGLTRSIEGESKEVIRLINESEAVKIAIDVPSGLFCDKTVIGVNDRVTIKADYTLTFAPPKLAFFFPENDLFAGEVNLLDIGIMQEFIDNTEVKNYMITREMCQGILKRRNKFSHKGTFGHALLISGSEGKMGAAVLAAKAALKSGAGLVTAHVPRCGITIMQTALPEAMADIDVANDCFSSVNDLAPYAAIGVGPGLGKSNITQNALKLLIQNTGSPLIIDADAINILGENKTWIPFIPKGSIFTPHPKEFERLIGEAANDFERNKIQIEFSIKYGFFVILKGAHTVITTPDGTCYFNSTGNPGMATGGSGDVLTGILTGIKAQGYSPMETSILGVYLHGLAGDLAMNDLGMEALIAGDIINFLGQAFKTLYG